MLSFVSLVQILELCDGNIIAFSAKKRNLFRNIFLKVLISVYILSIIEGKNKEAL